MITWGISANSHDAAISVHHNDVIKFASHTERFSHKKNDAHLTPSIVDYSLQWGTPDRIIWYEKPLLKTTRQLYAGQKGLLQKNRIKKYLESFGLNTMFLSNINRAFSYFLSLYNFNPSSKKFSLLKDELIKLIIK